MGGLDKVPWFMTWDFVDSKTRLPIIMLNRARVSENVDFIIERKYFLRAWICRS